MIKFRYFLLLLTLFFTVQAGATEDNLLPKPKSLTVKNEVPFCLKGKICVDDATNSTLLKQFLTDAGATLSKKAKKIVSVQLVDAATLDLFDYELYGYESEGYKLQIGTNGITIVAASRTGVIRAVQTMMQLYEGNEQKHELPAVDITDWAAFKLRGYMHDVGRSFVAFDKLLRHVDLLSRFKLNTFHWHFTENQAWRFEVKSHPELTEAKSMTRFPGLFYTQEQIAYLEQYAYERGVVVIPEIDMPGHSEAFERATGFTMHSAEGRVILKEVLSEMAQLFKHAPYIHIGADESRSASAEFIREMADYVHALGKKVVVWNPIVGMKINPQQIACDMTQMWGTAGRLVPGVPNIDCRYNYINHYDVFADVVGIYKSSVYYAQQGNPEIAGSLTGVWNDRNLPTDDDIMNQNNFFASILASAERAWMGGGKQYIEQGGVTLPNEGDEYDEFVDWERRFLHHKEGVLASEPIPYVKQTHQRWRITSPMPLNNSSEKASDTTRIVTGAGIYLRHCWPTIVPALYDNPQFDSMAYAWTYVYSPVDQIAGALIEFQTYSRSERDEVPAAGEWDFKGSRVWLNEEELHAPNWQNAGKAITNEDLLLDENMTARAPIQVQLKKGWNKVFLKLPFIKLDAKKVRLNKWYFAFALTTPDGRNALEGLIYNPDYQPE